MPDVTPLDIMGAEFPKAFRGFDQSSVKSFLQQLAASLENLVRERGELRQRIHFLEEELGAYKERESALKEALVSAQCSAEETLENARIEAQRTLAEGHNLAERIVDEAQERAENIELAIAELRARRRETRGELKRFLEVLQGVIHDDEDSEKQERLRPQLAILHRKGEQQKA